MDRPINNCYWVLPGKLLAGEYPRNKDEPSSEWKLAALGNAGVNVFVDLTEAGELTPYADVVPTVTHHRFPVRDVSVPSSVELTTILDAVDEHITEGNDHERQRHDCPGSLQGLFGGPRCWGCGWHHGGVLLARYV